MQLVIKGGCVLAHYNDAVSLTAEHVPAGAFVQAYDGLMDDLGRFGPAPIDGLPDTRSYKAPPFDALAYAKRRRWEIETAGIEVGGVHVATDDRSKTLLMGARDSAAEDPAFTTTWDAADGSEHELDADTIKALAIAVAAHVAKVFRAFSTVRKAITAGTVTTAAQIDAALAAALA